MLFGDMFAVEERKDGWVRGMAMKDAYRGWVEETQLAPYPPLKKGDFARHYVAVRSAWGYEAPDLKSQPLIDLHMTSTVFVTGKSSGWIEFVFKDRRAYLPVAHCKPSRKFFDTPPDAARAFLGTPYVWAGNTGFGLDCSGLVQVALRACHVHCRADSHQQEEHTKGQRLADEELLQAGDLVFWKGHVAMATGPGTIIHANAHHMAVVEEPAAEAIERITVKEGKPVTSRIRPDLSVGFLSEGPETKPDDD